MQTIMITSENLRLVRDREGLFRLLRQKLGWPSVDPEDPFTYDIRLDGLDVKANVSQIVPFGADDPHPVMLVETDGDFKRGQLREILRGVRGDMRNRARFKGKTISDIVFIVASNGYRDMRFCRFVEQEGRQPKLQAFGWAKGEEGATRTLREVNLPALKMPSERATGGWDWDAKTWQDAWNVEKVQKEFFQGLKAVFEKYLDAIILVSETRKGQKLIDKGEDVARLMLQTIVNRLLFLALVQKKGWLAPPGNQGEGREKEYLFALYDEANPEGNDFDFHDRMRQLFFQGLCEPDDKIRKNDANLQRIGKVPYLHGSLFEAGKYEQKSGHYANLGWIKLPNAFYGELIGPDGVFRKFNFTISESTPDDIEVAVDPEMLGLVFEELMTLREAQESSRRRGDDPRHATGSYYTPRNIVQFMCREALKVYLEPFASRVDIEALVDRHTLSGTDIPLADLKSAVEKVKVCDPACGSGAYLVGMLHELNEVLKVLDSRIAEGEIEAARTDYKRKLLLLQNAIYGVDLQEFAANMARLRFWLSVAVDMVEPEPLPNLEYKIEFGDTLLAPDPSTVGDLFLQAIHEAADRVGKLKTEYSDPFDPSNKAELKRKIDEDLAALRRAAEQNAPCPTGVFDWRVEFAEVFIERDGKGGGFDIVLANPPYIRQEEIDGLNSTFPRGYKAFLLSKYAPACTGKSDLYAYFYVRSCQLLRQGGCQIHICSNSWLDVIFGTSLQKFLLENSRVRKIIDSSVEKQFTTADINTIISVISKGRSSDEPTTDFVLLKGPFDESVYDSSLQRVVRKSYSEIKRDASDARNLYTLGKWGGLYLRAPDIYLELLEKYRGQLIPLYAAADLTTGTKSNADEFFYTELRNEGDQESVIVDAAGNLRRIETDLVRVPLLKAPEDARIPRLDLSRLRSRRLALPDDLSSYPLAREYVDWAEKELRLQDRPTLRNVNPWWRYRPQGGSDFLLPVKPKRSIVLSWVQGLEVNVNKSFYLVRVQPAYDPMLVAATLFSTFGAIAREVMGRANFGQGVLEIIAVEARLLPVLKNVSEPHRTEIRAAFEAMLNRPVKVVYNELRLPDRRRLDRAVLLALGVPLVEVELVIDAVQDAARRLVWNRQAKPGNFMESRFDYEEWLASGREFPVRGENN